MKFILLFLLPIMALAFPPSDDRTEEIDYLLPLNQSQVQVSSDFVVTGQTTLDVALEGFLKATSGVVSSQLLIDLTTDVTGVLPIANGGTGSATQNFVDLTTTQSIAGDKTFNNLVETLGVVATGSTTDAASTGANVSLSTPTTEVVRVTNAGLTSIDMIVAPTVTQKMVLTNHTGAAVTINNATGATAADQILTGTGDAIDLEDEASLTLVYDLTETKWQIVGGSGGGGGGTFQEIYANSLPALMTVDNTNGGFTVENDNTSPASYIFRANASGGASVLNVEDSSVTLTAPTLVEDSLTVTTTTGTFVPPRMTEVQRDALTPVQGAVIYNTDVSGGGELQIYNGTEWTSAGSNLVPNALTNEFARVVIPASGNGGCDWFDRANNSFQVPQSDADCGDAASGGEVIGNITMTDTKVPSFTLNEVRQGYTYKVNVVNRVYKDDITTPSVNCNTRMVFGGEIKEYVTNFYGTNTNHVEFKNFGIERSFTAASSGDVTLDFEIKETILNTCQIDTRLGPWEMVVTEIPPKSLIDNVVKKQRLREVRAYRVAAFNIPDNTVQKVIMDAEEADDDNLYSTSTGLFSCPEAGSKWLIGWNVEFSNLQGGAFGTQTIYMESDGGRRVNLGRKQGTPSSSTTIALSNAPYILECSSDTETWEFGAYCNEIDDSNCTVTAATLNAQRTTLLIKEQAATVNNYTPLEDVENQILRRVRATKNAQQVLSDATWTTIQYDLEFEDTHNLHNNGVFTCPEAGSRWSIGFSADFLNIDIDASTQALLKVISSDGNDFTMARTRGFTNTIVALNSPKFDFECASQGQTWSFQAYCDNIDNSTCDIRGATQPGNSGTLSISEIPNQVNLTIATKKCQTKTLPADDTSGGPVNALHFNNLDTTKTYSLFWQARFIASSQNCQLYYDDGVNTLGQVRIPLTSVTPENRYIGLGGNPAFIPATSTLTATFVENTTCTMEGNSNTGETYATLCEEVIEFTNDWD